MAKTEDTEAPVTWLPIRPIGATEIAERVNARNSNGGRGWVTAYSGEWLAAARQLAGTPEPAPVIEPQPEPTPAPEVI